MQRATATKLQRKIFVGHKSRSFSENQYALQKKKTLESFGMKFESQNRQKLTVVMTLMWICWYLTLEINSSLVFLTINQPTMHKADGKVDSHCKHIEGEIYCSVITEENVIQYINRKLRVWD